MVSFCGVLVKGLETVSFVVMGSGTVSFWKAVRKRWEMRLNSEYKVLLVAASEVSSQKRLRSRSRDPFEKLGS